MSDGYKALTVLDLQEVIKQIGLSTETRLAVGQIDVNSVEPRDDYVLGITTRTGPQGAIELVLQIKR